MDSIKSAEIQNIISKMKKVHRDYKLVGLAAPQIGISLRIIIIEASEELKEKYPAEVYKNRQMEIMPLTVKFLHYHCGFLIEIFYDFSSLINLFFPFEGIHQSGVEYKKFQSAEIS